MQFLAIDLIELDGHESYCEGRDLPLLQETAEYPVWDDWAAEWRDVFVLDADGVVVDIYNLTSHSLGEEANVAEFEQIIATALGG